MKSEIEKKAIRPGYAVSGEPVLFNASNVWNKCGCKVVGNGKASHPLNVKLCSGHSAAPELLEACKAAFEMMDFYAGKPFPPRWAETMHEIKSAIAKATSHSTNHNADQSRLNKGV